jgi:hypothetical protein
VAVAPADTVYVAAPTGERETDRENVQAAFDAVQPGGTVVFAAGTYVVGGEGLVLRTPGVALRGDPDGTTLQGCTQTQRRSPCRQCSPNSLRRAATASSSRRRRNGSRACASSHSASRSVSERRRRAEAQGRSASFTGGHVVEDNSFHDGISFEIVLDADSTVRVRRNAFRNVWHAVAIVGGRNIHVTENDVSVPEPERVPFGFAGVAIGALADADGACSSMIVEGNRIDGHTEALAIAVFPHRLPGSACSDITIRDNEIVMRPVRRPDGRLAIAPAIRLFNAQRLVSEGLIEWGEPPEGGWPDALSEGRISDVRVEGNRITGAVGIGIEAAHVTDTRIVDNEIEVRPAATPEETGRAHRRRECCTWRLGTAGSRGRGERHARVGVGGERGDCRSASAQET